MELIISSIGDKGNIIDERIGFKVLEDCQLNNYIIFKTYKVTPTTFYHKNDNIYWFIPKEVKKNDKIVLYTKTGNESVIHNADGSSTYFFYWGLIKPIFDNPDKIVVLINAKSWEMSP
jgi:hypothetical protein